MTSPSGAPRTGAEFSPAARAAIALAFAALVAFRLPEVVLRGRFYAEEGAFFFAYAWRMPATDNAGANPATPQAGDVGPSAAEPLRRPERKIAAIGRQT